MSDATPSDDASPPALWLAARHLLDWLVATVGGPAVIASLGLLSPRLRKEILGWLRPAEAMARMLLLLEAARLAATHGEAPARERRERAPREPRFAAQDPEDSGAWRVAFRTAGRAATAPAAPVAPADMALRLGLGRLAAPDLLNPWPLAERIEAAAGVARPPRQKPGGRAGLGDWAMAQLTAQAEVALAAWDTS